ncbi:bifunctional RNase H/acid phosphatase [Planosporangium flavigriseum]|uniref:Putative phosphoglycerate mutase n=1 Tax=Planosporangium flavigriseum TaxID=373681 RepID=A0A8J3LP84_9ACTN|nr:bifunctional RNase H/acid phosphatase [Planosporangium flavigriseum]GIG75337.1 putative phosphoglycerate mutase [Planosporangium flavigriseum]
MRVVVEADGGSRGNPGTAGYGAVVLDADTGELLAERMGALGVTTNNVAEYRGLIAGLTAAAELGADEVEVRMDSKLVVEQMSGRWQIKHPGLRPLAAQAADLVRRFKSVKFNWIPRERNKRADALANRAMDGKPAPEEPASAAVATAARADSPAASAQSWAPPAGPATRLILVRHGETEYTARRLYSGRGEAQLTPRGLAQARAVASRVGPVAAVVTSHLSRCARTAELIAQAAGGVPVRVEPDLVECDFGKWEGLTFAEVNERWPEEMQAWLASPAVAPPGGESFDEVAVRVSRAVQRLREAYAGERVAVVTHVSPIKLVLREALDAGPGFLYRCYLDPAGMSTVDYWPDGGIAVRGVNETAHLADTG